MKKVIVVVVLLCFAGCGGLHTITPEQPFGADFDPNTATAYVDASAAVGTATTEVGVLLGKPELIGLGILLTTLGAAFGKIVGKKEKE